MKRVKLFWIKERRNPSGTYFVALGQLSKAAAKRHTKPLHGTNIMWSFSTEDTYNAKIKELKSNGDSFI